MSLEALRIVTGVPMDIIKDESAPENLLLEIAASKQLPHLVESHW